MRSGWWARAAAKWRVKADQPAGYAIAATKRGERGWREVVSSPTSCADQTAREMDGEGGS